MMVASIVSVAGLVVAAPVAAADPCPPLDIGCVVDDTTTTAGGVVDDTTTTAVGVVDDTVTTAGGVFDDTVTTAGGVVDDTTTTVGGVVTGVGTVDPGTVVTGVIPGGLSDGGGVIPGGGVTPTGGGSTPPTGGGSTPSGGGGSVPSDGTHVASPSSGDRLTAVPAVGATGAIPAPAGIASTTAGHPFPSFLDGGPGALLSGARLARTFAFPLGLILLVIGFVFVQHRIDRKDPKLALAPVGSDHLTFS
jgi:hypothetical protein